MPDAGVGHVECGNAVASDDPAHSLHESVVLDDLIVDGARSIEPACVGWTEERLEAPDDLCGTLEAHIVERVGEPPWLLMAELIKAEAQSSEQAIAPPAQGVAMHADCEPQWSLDDEADSVPAAPLLLAVCAPSPQGAVAPSRDRNGYLERARRAAQAQNLALQRETTGLLAKLRDNRASTLSMSAGAVALLLLGGAVLAFNADGDAQASVTRRETTSAVPGEQAFDSAAAYEASQQLMADGRVEEGVRLLSRAAEGGLPLAQYRLSKRYEVGDGVPRNLSLALVWAERAARAGNVRAMHDVGVYYARGEGAPRDETAALAWFRQAAEFGVADSQYNLGLLYQQGRGIAADPQAALFWFLVAARNHDVDAVDRAVEVAASLSPEEVADVRERARAFRSRTPVASANEADS